MTKRQLIDEILARNATADAEFLARFDESDLDAYLTKLRRLQMPRLTGDASRYEKYFAYNTPARPIRVSRTDPVSSPCLPEEEDKADDSFWHLGREFESDDETLRRRVDRFAEQLVDRMNLDETSAVSRADYENDEDDDYDDEVGPISYHRIPAPADEEFDEPLPELNDPALQRIGSRSESPRRDGDSWLF